MRGTVVSSPAGPFSLLEHDNALVGAGFTAEPEEILAELHRSLRGVQLKVVADLGELSRAVGAYFAGQVTALDALPVHQPAAAGRHLGSGSGRLKYYYGAPTKRWLLDHERADR